MEADTRYERYRQAMEQFPCAFNIVITKVTRAKLKAMKHNLVSELDVEDESDSERIIKLNLLTWVQFHLGEEEEALQQNNVIVSSTNWKNVASVGNRFFIRWQIGDTNEAEYCLSRLKEMKLKDNFSTLLTDAKAEQMYYYSRFGTPVSFQHAIDLFSALPQTPVNYLRTFGIGLVYRRATRSNMVHVSNGQLDEVQCQTRAAECLFEVAENADARLSSMAYAQLVILRRSYPERLSDNIEELFHGLSVEELCEKALEHGSDISSVLSQCGIAMRRIDIDKSIEYLRKSVDIKPNSPAYHHLGISYKQKAQQLATRNIFRHTESISDESEHTEDQYVEQNMTDGSYEAPGPSRRIHDMPTCSSTTEHPVNYQRRMTDDDINDDTSYKINHKYEQLGNEFKFVNDDSLYLPNTNRKRHGFTETSETATAKRARYQECEYTDHENTEEAKTVFRNKLSMKTGQIQDSATYEGNINNVQPLNSEPRRQCYDRPASYDGDEHINEQGRGRSVTQINQNSLWKDGNARDSPWNDGDARGSHWKDGNARDSPWNDGDGSHWKDGNARDSPWNDGDARGSHWKDGNARDSPWNDGDARGSHWKDGNARDSPWNDGDARGSHWKDGNARDSPWNDGDARGSHWKDGNARDSPWNDGDARGSHWKDGNARDSPWNDGDARGSHWKERNPTGSHCRGRNPRGSHCRGRNPRGSHCRGRKARGSHCRGRNPRGSLYRDSNPRDTGNNRHNRDNRWGGRNKRNNVHLSMDDENVKQARECFRKAIDIAKENYPAAIDLGVLLKEANQIHDALQQFNSITSSYAPSISHTSTVISAYEQAGLCYLQLSERNGRDNNEDTGKRKLVKAISLAARLVHTMPELQGNLEDVWTALKSRVTRIGTKQIYCSNQPKRNILELAREYRDTIPVIQDLQDIGEGGLNDYVVIKERLYEYLKSNQPETALAFQNLVALNPGVKNSDWWQANRGDLLALRIKVLLLAISERLSAKSDNPTFLFQQIFELVFGSCLGMCDPESDQQTGASGELVGDVLFLVDTGDAPDDAPDEADVCPTVKAACCLKQLTACFFGLEVDENLKGCATYSDSVIEKQLNRMKEYHAVVIVLGNEKRSKDFQAVLRRLKDNPTDPLKQKILIIDAGFEDSHIPLSLNQYARFRLQDIRGLGDISLSPGTAEETDIISYVNILNHVFHGHVNSVIKLFCFITGQNIPSD